MKKLFLTIIISSLTFLASAQFMVVSTVNAPADNEEWGISNFTDNMGIGYQIDNFVIGAMQDSDDYNLFGRYLINDLYISLQMPLNNEDNTTDNMSIGVGYSFSVWQNIYVEPNYTMPMKEDENGEREGAFNLGVAYRF